MTRLLGFVSLLVVSVLCCAVFGQAAQSGVNASDVLSTLDRKHPRLMLKDEDMSRLRQLHKQDRALQKCVDDVLEQADRSLRDRPLTYQKIGPRLLHISRRCMQRMYALGLAYRWTGEEKYARGAVENLLTVCDFKDWNPSHFLDTAEMSHAVGLGYDWLYSYMDEGTRKKVRQGLIKNGMEAGLAAYQKQWWRRSEHNWNQVCNGGMIVGALAIAESDPQYAEVIIPAALESLPRALNSYNPDGAWMEGPGYWSYATHYTAYGLTALMTALNTDFELLQTPGLAKTGNFPIYTAGPTGMFVNFADCGERSSRRTAPCMFWLARTFDDPVLAQDEHEAIARYRASPQHIVWYVPNPKETLPPRDLDRYFRGRVEVATFRSAWGDRDALFVGVKAGYNQVNHGHLDLGNFELDALGERWARDLGSDDYNMDGYWDSKRGGKRWSYYRLNSSSHNVPMLAGQDQDPLARSAFLKVSANNASPFAVVDLTDAYKASAKRVTRGVRLVRNRKAALIQDDFELKEPCELLWGITTDAKITADKSTTARLNIGDKKLIARILSPAGAGFGVESAEQKPPQKTNKAVSRLVLRLPKAEGEVRIAILLSPVWKDGEVVENAGLQPVDEW